MRLQRLLRSAFALVLCFLQLPAYVTVSQPLLQLLFAALGDSDPQVQSNGAFASGMLVENTEADLSSQYLPLLAALRPLFEVTEGSPHARLNAKDNATGAVARMITKNTEAVPLDQVSTPYSLDEC